MLACALGAGYLSILENIDSLSAEYGVVVGGSQCIGKVCLVSNPVAAVFRLSVDGVAGNAEYLLLLHKRDIVAACTIPCGHGGSDPMGAGVAGVNSVVLIYQRLVPVFLGSKCPCDVQAALHHTAALVVQA